MHGAPLTPGHADQAARQAVAAPARVAVRHARALSRLLRLVLRVQNTVVGGYSDSRL